VVAKGMILTSNHHSITVDHVALLLANELLPSLVFTTTKT
jgi:hypothetical protein